MGRRAGVDGGAVEVLGGDRPGTARHQARTLTQCRRPAGDGLQVHPVVAVLAGIERPVGGDPVDGNQGAVDYQVGVPGLGGVPQRRAQLRGPGGEQRHGLDDIPLGRGGAAAEPGRQSPAQLGHGDVLRRRVHVVNVTSRSASGPSLSTGTTVRMNPPCPRRTCLTRTASRASGSTMTSPAWTSPARIMASTEEDTTVRGDRFHPGCECSMSDMWTAQGSGVFRFAGYAVNARG
jgi:hypothetical protein